MSEFNNRWKFAVLVTAAMTVSNTIDIGKIRLKLTDIEEAVEDVTERAKEAFGIGSVGDI